MSEYLESLKPSIEAFISAKREGKKIEDEATDGILEGTIDRLIDRKFLGVKSSLITDCEEIFSKLENKIGGDTDRDFREAYSNQAEEIEGLFEKLLFRAGALTFPIIAKETTKKKEALTRNRRGVNIDDSAEKRFPSYVQRESWSLVSDWELHRPYILEIFSSAGQVLRSQSAGAKEEISEVNNQVKLSDALFTLLYSVDKPSKLYELSNEKIVSTRKAEGFPDLDGEYGGSVAQTGNKGMKGEGAPARADLATLNLTIKELINWQVEKTQVLQSDEIIVLYDQPNKPKSHDYNKLFFDYPYTGLERRSPLYFLSLTQRGISQREKKSWTTQGAGNVGTGNVVGSGNKIGNGNRVGGVNVGAGQTTEEGGNVETGTTVKGGSAQGSGNVGTGNVVGSGNKIGYGNRVGDVIVPGSGNQVYVGIGNVGSAGDVTVGSGNAGSVLGGAVGGVVKVNVKGDAGKPGSGSSGNVTLTGVGNVGSVGDVYVGSSNVGNVAGFVGASILLSVANQASNFRRVFAAMGIFGLVLYPAMLLMLPTGCKSAIAKADKQDSD